MSFKFPLLPRSTAWIAMSVLYAQQCRPLCIATRNTASIIIPFYKSNMCRPLPRFPATTSSHSFNHSSFSQLVKHAGNYIFYCGVGVIGVWRRFSTSAQRFVADCAYLGRRADFGHQSVFKQLQVPGNPVCAATRRQSSICAASAVSTRMHG